MTKHWRFGGIGTIGTEKIASSEGVLGAVDGLDGYMYKISDEKGLRGYIKRICKEIQIEPQNNPGYLIYDRYCAPSFSGSVYSSEMTASTKVLHVYQGTKDEARKHCKKLLEEHRIQEMSDLRRRGEEVIIIESE